MPKRPGLRSKATSGHDQGSEPASHLESFRLRLARRLGRPVDEAEARKFALHLAPVARALLRALPSDPDDEVPGSLAGEP